MATVMSGPKIRIVVKWVGGRHGDQVAKGCLRGEAERRKRLLEDHNSRSRIVHDLGEGTGSGVQKG